MKTVDILIEALKEIVEISENWKDVGDKVKTALVKISQNTHPVATDNQRFPTNEIVAWSIEAYGCSCDSCCVEAKAALTKLNQLEKGLKEIVDSAN